MHYYFFGAVASYRQAAARNSQIIRHYRQTVPLSSGDKTNELPHQPVVATRVVRLGRRHGGRHGGPEVGPGHAGSKTKLNEVHAYSNNHPSVLLAEVGSVTMMPSISSARFLKSSAHFCASA